MLIVVSATLPPVLGHPAVYQEDFFTPGSLPSFANERKQMRHMPNWRMKPRERPHGRSLHITAQRLRSRTVNFAVRLDFTIRDIFAIARSCSPCYFVNGMPRSSSSRLPSSSLRAEVITLICMPRTRSTWSNDTSGKMICSVNPSE